MVKRGEGNHDGKKGGNHDGKKGGTTMVKRGEPRW